MKREEQKSGLPSGFKRLEYLESNGTQYIDTGVSVDNTIGFELTFQLTSKATTSQANGQQDWINANTLVRIDPCCSAGKFRSYFVNHDTSFPETTYADSDFEWHTISIKNGSQSFDGVEYYNTTMTHSTEDTLWFFAANVYGSGNKYNCYEKVSSCVVRKGDLVVRNYVPALRLADNKPGMYDLQNNVFYTNQGTGEFLYK